MQKKYTDMIKYTVKLTKAEVDELNAIINKGSHTSHSNWQFKTKDARIKLKKLYPSIHD